MIIYKDECIVVCEKPYGISSQESNGKNMISLLEKELGGKIYPVHRLDIQTTGLMVYARDSQSAACLSNEIVEGVVIKEYLTVCHGELSGNGEMEDYLYHDRIKNKSFAVDKKRGGSKRALLEYEQILTDENERGESLTLLRIRLHTGRTHQIRAQLSKRGHFLYGDGKYGAKDNDRIALHSYKLTLVHPKTKEKLVFNSYPSGSVWERYAHLWKDSTHH